MFLNTSSQINADAFRARGKKVTRPLSCIPPYEHQQRYYSPKSSFYLLLFVVLFFSRKRRHQNPYPYGESASPVQRSKRETLSSDCSIQTVAGILNRGGEHTSFARVRRRRWRKYRKRDCDDADGVRVRQCIWSDWVLVRFARVCESIRRRISFVE